MRTYTRAVRNERMLREEQGHRFPPAICATWTINDIIHDSAFRPSYCCFLYTTKFAEKEKYAVFGNNEVGLAENLPTLLTAVALHCHLHQYIEHKVAIHRHDRVGHSCTGLVPYRMFKHEIHRHSLGYCLLSILAQVALQQLVPEQPGSFLPIYSLIK